MSKKHTNGNGLATADDFRKARNAITHFAMDEYEPPEPVTLPKLGKAVLLRRPTPIWHASVLERLPTTLVSKIENAGTDGFKPSVEQLKQYSEFAYKILRDIMVSPKVNVEPGPGEISPDLIDMEDVRFMVDWAMGEKITVATEEGTEARSLDTFREGGEPPHARVNG